MAMSGTSSSSGKLNITRSSNDRGSSSISRPHPLLRAASDGNLVRLKNLVAELIDQKDLPSTIAGIKDPQGYSAIHLSVLKGHLEVCKYLIADLKLDVDLKEPQTGKTPLHCAAFRGFSEIGEYLLSKGANADETMDNGCTALHVAAESAKDGQLDMVLSLLKAGANPNVIDEVRRTPLDIAATKGRKDVVEVLFPVTSATSSYMDGSAHAREASEPRLSFRTVLQKGLHTEIDVPSDQIVSSGAPIPVSEKLEPAISPLRAATRNVCHFWVPELNYCRYGDECMFLHGPDLNQFRDKPCPFLRSDGYCKFGRGCLWKH